jgi:DNA-binding NtrC family response regulator
MPGMDGLELQARLLALGILLPVIVMTGQGDVQSAVRAMKAGAVDFIEKPYDDTSTQSRRRQQGLAPRTLITKRWRLPGELPRSARANARFSMHSSPGAPTR